MIEVFFPNPTTGFGKVLMNKLPTCVCVCVCPNARRFADVFFCNCQLKFLIDGLFSLGTRKKF